MFKFKAIKINGKTTIEYNGNYSVAEIDISLKDICIYLRLNKNNSDEFINENDGFLIVEVRHHKRELSSIEKSYANINRYPMNEVIVESKGFEIEYIKEIMKCIQNQLPDEISSHFNYKVDFIKLIIE